MNLIVLQLLLTIVGGLVALVLNYFCDGKSGVALIKSFCLGVFSTAMTQAAVIFMLVFGAHDFMIYTPPVLASTKVTILYTAVVLLAIAIEQLIALAFRGQLAFDSNQEADKWTRFHIGDIFLALFSTLFTTVAAIMYLVPSRLVMWFGQMSADQLVYTVTAGGSNSTAEVEAEMLTSIYLPVAFVAILGLSLVFWRRDLILKLKNGVLRCKAKIGRRIVLALFALMAVVSVLYAFHTLPLAKVIKSVFIPDTYFEDNYVEPSSSVLKFPDKKRNVLHIYMESFENSYFDKANGGYDEQNLAPELLELSKEGITFSDTNVMGGPWQTTGSEHSVAAMVNFWSGVPMKTITKNNQSFNFEYPKFMSLGDIFAAEGYNEEFMLGADVAWGNLGDYYLSHGNFKIFDHQYAIDNGYIPKDYRVWWGYEDDKLYAWAKDELTALSQEDKPFYFVLENADTHRPDGYVSPNMTEKPFDKQYANVIHYSQKEVVNFVRWAQKQPWYENTTIIITGDHQSMDQAFFEGWDPNYRRTVFNLILNSAVPKPDENVLKNRQYAPFDYFPTILAASGVEVEGNRLGLGTNLFSGEKTLIERDGEAEVNERLQNMSPYYNEYQLKQYH